MSEGHRPTDGPAVNADGEMFFSDPRTTGSTRSALDGKVASSPRTRTARNGMMFGPDGRLYAGATAAEQIVAYDASGRTQVVAEDVAVNDLAINVKGDIYFTDSPARRSGSLPKGGKPRVVDEGIEYPNGVLFSPDQTLLYVSDYAGQLSWAFQIQPDGSLAHKQRYFYVHMPDAATRSSADGMAVDANGNVYIATALGVQVFDQIGKCHAIIPAPAGRVAVEREVRRRRPGRALRHRRREGVQAEDEGERGRVVAGARQATRATPVGADVSGDHHHHHHHHQSK